MTYLELVNEVLARLREPAAASVSDSVYTTAISKLVNTTKREVEMAWRWTTLQSTFDISLGVTTDSTYACTDWGKQAQIRYAWDVTNNSRLSAMTDERWDRMVDLGGTVSSDRALYWRLQGYDSSDDPLIEVYPVPPLLSLSTVRVYGYVPQSDLSADTDSLSVPDYPVILGAYARAVSERGEDAGASYDETFRDYQSSLNDAISRDSGNEQFGFASDWQII